MFKTVAIFGFLFFAAAQLNAASGVKSGMVKYKSGSDEVSAYLAQPEAKGTYPAVIMIHEWWGLNAWVKSMADSLAASGYVVLAVDLYRGKVGTTSDEAMQLMSGLPTDRAKGDLQAAYAYVKSLGTGNVGSVGWCMGGGYSLTTALNVKGLSACVINYGRLVTDAATLKAISCPVLGNFGGKDNGILVKGVMAFKQAVEANGQTADIKVYDNSGHAFMNPNNKGGYVEVDAKDAWGRTVAFFDKTLKK